MSTLVQKGIDESIIGYHTMGPFGTASNDRAWIDSPSRKVKILSPENERLSIWGPHTGLNARRTQENRLANSGVGRAEKTSRSKVKVQVASWAMMQTSMRREALTKPFFCRSESDHDEEGVLSSSSSNDHASEKSCRSARRRGEKEWPSCCHGRIPKQLSHPLSCSGTAAPQPGNKRTTEEKPFRQHGPIRQKSSCWGSYLVRTSLPRPQRST